MSAMKSTHCVLLPGPFHGFTILEPNFKNTIFTLSEIGDDHGKKCIFLSFPATGPPGSYSFIMESAASC